MTKRASHSNSELRFSSRDTGNVLGLVLLVGVAIFGSMVGYKMVTRHVAETYQISNDGP